MLTLLFCGALALFNVALISFVLFLVGIFLRALCDAPFEKSLLLRSGMF